MKYLTSIVSALCLGISVLPGIQASPLEGRAPTPTRPFTVSAFESPLPLGQGVTGLNMTARGGSFYLSAKGKPSVLYTTPDSRAYLDSKNDQPIYIDTVDGHLGYASPAPPGAVFVGFLHLGKGNQIFTPIPGGNGAVSTAPSTFEWIGSFNDFWFACPDGKGDYLVVKLVNNFGPPDRSNCDVFSASALDYTGANPAADNYA